MILQYQIKHIYIIQQNRQEMQFETSLKRNKLAQTIRIEQRERIKKQIRDKFNEAIQKEIKQQTFDDEQFKKLKYQCRKHNFNINTIHNSLEYLFSKNVRLGLCQEINLKFVDQVCCRLDAMADQGALQIRLAIKNKLLEVLQLQMAQSAKDEKGNLSPTSQLSQLPILKICFDGFLTLIQTHHYLSQLWIPISQLRNQELKNYSFINFERWLNTNIDNLQSEDISIIAISLYNYLEDCPHQIHKFIAIIDVLFIKYNISPFDAIRIIDSLIVVVSGVNVQSKIKVIVEDTSIVQNVTAYLDKSNQGNVKNSFDLTGKVAEFVAKLYSVDDQELCSKVYMCNIMILGHIRSWLPVAPNLQVHMLEHMGSGTLLHSNHKCTMYLIFALTNIVVSDQGFIQTVLVKSDIYRALVSIYKLVPLSCREQIATFIRNMVHKCDTGSLRIMLQTKLPDILTEMLKEINSDIIRYALSSILVIFASLDEDQGNNMSQFLYTKRRFQISLQNMGAIKIIESLVHSPEQEIITKAINVLQFIN